MELFDKKFVYLEWDEVLEGKKVFLADTLTELRRFVERGYPVWIVKKHHGDYPFVTEGSVVWHAMAYYDPNYECKVAYAQGKVIQCRNKGDDNWVVTSSPNWVDGCEYRVKPESEMWTTCINDEGVISVMPAREWNKNKGMQLIECTNEECQCYAVENYCDRCACQASCVGQKCTMKINAWYCQGFRELKPVKKRRMTNRELAQWVAQGNGECMGDEIAMSCWRYVYNEADMPVKDDVQIRWWNETEWHEPEVEEDVV